ncbi:Hint domain-containing protein [Profundibacter sp.]
MFGLKSSVLGRTFKTSETTGAYDGADRSATGMASGLVAGTKIATNIGWRVAEAIAPGDQVLTFDGGMQVVRRITRSVLWSSPKNCPEHLWPLDVPAGAMGNQREMMLLPEQNVMIESDAAEEMFGDPFVMIPAAAFSGFRGITRVRPHTKVVVYTLYFEHEQVVFACSGVLFHCPSDATASLLDMDQGASVYTAFSLKDAGMLVECLATENLSAETPEMAGISAAA